MNINTFDYNLLKVFNALMAERNVTRAAKKIGLAQSSMSNALSRLRYSFDDELFVRTPKGMVPTERALSLSPMVDSVLIDIQRMIEVSQPFNISKATGNIRIATSDNVKILFAPQLSKLLEAEAPLLNVQYISLEKTTVFQEIDENEIDIAIGTFGELPKRFESSALYYDSFVCLARAANPKLKKGLTLRKFAELPHVLMTLNRDTSGIIDSLLAEKGLSRRVAATVDQFTILPHLVESTDYLAICPKSIAPIITRGSACQTYSMPLEQKQWPVSMVWGKASASSSTLTWIRNSLLRISRINF